MQAKQTEIERRFEKLVGRSARVVTVIRALDQMASENGCEQYPELICSLIHLAEELARELPDDLERCQTDSADYARNITEEWRKLMDEVADYRTGRKTAAGGGK
jgi:hypothetical protein